MKKIAIVAAAMLIAMAGHAFAQSASQSTPGHQSGNRAKDAMPGQSGYAPGHQSGNVRKDAKPGQSGYAPGHNKATTGSRSSEPIQRR